MQKALTEMNIGLHHVLSDLTGVSGLAIIRAILEGERDTRKLASLKHPYVRKSPEEIAQALEGDYREEHLFALRQALELYEAYQMRIAECDTKIQVALRALAPDEPAPGPGEPPRPNRVRRQKRRPISPSKPNSKRSAEWI
jgi:hypothetical protein